MMTPLHDVPRIPESVPPIRCRHKPPCAPTRCRHQSEIGIDTTLLAPKPAPCNSGWLEVQTQASSLAGKAALVENLGHPHSSPRDRRRTRSAPRQQRQPVMLQLL